MLWEWCHLSGPPWPQSNQEKNSRQTQIEVQGTWPVLLKTGKVIRNKESLRHKQSPEEAKAIWWLSCDVVSWMDVGTEKVH